VALNLHSFYSGVERLFELIARHVDRLELKFGEAGLRLLPEIYKIENVDVLRAVHNGIRTVTTLDALRRIYQRTSGNGDGSSDGQ
jgi:hypothetical protein